MTGSRSTGKSFQTLLYLQRGTRREGAKVGALSGAFAFVPLLIVLVLFFLLFLLGPVIRGGIGGMGLVVVLLVVPLFLLWNVGLGAVGGYLGVSLRAEPA